MKIKIKIFSPRTIINLKLDGEKEFIEFNGRELNKNVEDYINRILNIVSSWQNSYYNPMILDSENFEVEIIKNKETKKFGGAGNFPENYAELKKLIGEIENCF